MNALALVNKLSIEKLGLTDEIAALATPNAEVKKFLWALNEVQRSLYDSFDFVKLKKQGTITLATDTTVYDLATDFVRFIRDKDPLYYTKVSTGATEIAKFTLVNDGDFKNHRIDTGVEEGRPYIGRLFGSKAITNVSQIEVHGNVTATYDSTVLYYEYIRALADLAADADTSPFSDHILINGGYLRLSVKNGDASPADFADFINASIRTMNNDSAGRIRKLKYRDW